MDIKIIGSPMAVEYSGAIETDATRRALALGDKDVKDEIIYVTSGLLEEINHLARELKSESIMPDEKNRIHQLILRTETEIYLDIYGVIRRTSYERPIYYWLPGEHYYLYKNNIYQFQKRYTEGDMYSLRDILESVPLS